ncbi:hypothetical protein NDN16_12845 [Aureimonas altamirensis]|uniref:hypothetical protein n=1 Tax=Aureimonas altamirensis TaxID=370622 RepID=UPI002036AF7A|nr:hypothetical protein [Aureimonas altamirensis]MCM2504556.1 hypothetical protein [Aureimonas altamirensis]
MGAIVFLWQSGRGHGWTYYGSDLVHPFLLAQDLLADPSSWTAWTHPPAPYIFPDVVVAAMLVTLPLSAAALPVAYAASLSLGYVAATASIARSASGAAWVTCLWTSCAGYAVLFALSGFTRGDVPDISAYLLAPFIHSGAVLFFLVSVALLLRTLSGSRRAGVLLGVVALLSTLSDTLYAVWFVAPALMTLLLLAANRGSIWPARIAALILAASGAGALLAHFALPYNKAYFEATASSPSVSLERFLASLAQLPAERDIALMIVLIAGFILAFRAAQLVARIRKLRFGQDGVAVLILAGAFGTALLAPVISGRFLDATSWRYSIVLPVLPLVFASLAVAASGWADRRIVSFVQVAVVSALCLVLLRQIPTEGHRLAISSELANCLPSGPYGIVGDYWTAKRNIFLSDRRFHVLQVRPDGSPYAFNYNGRWFFPGGETGVPEPTAVWLDRLDGESIRHKYGDPTEIRTCSGSEVWLYDDVLAPYDMYYRADRLPGHVGTVEGSDRRVEDGSLEGFALFGPHIDLPRGRYEIWIDYTAEEFGHRWEVTGNAGNIIFASGILDPGYNSQRVVIDIPSEVSLFEVRVWFTAESGPLTLRGFGLRYLKAEGS